MTPQQIAIALSQIYNADLPRVCPFCEPDREGSFYAAVCHEHLGVA